MKSYNYYIDKFTEWFGNEFINRVPSHKLRLIYYKSVTKLKIGIDSNISLYCIFNRTNNIKIGNNVAINQEVYLDGRGKLVIGNNVNIGRRVCIYTSQHDPQSSQFEYVEKKTVIKNNVWIASNVVLIPGITIGEGAVIAAGAVVTKDISAYTIVGGNPAKFISKRNTNLKYKTKWSPIFY